MPDETHKRAHSTKPFHKGKQISIIGALRLDGFVGGMMIERTVNGDVFLTLVQKILVSELSQEELSLSIILAHTRLKESEKPLKLLG